MLAALPCIVDNESNGIVLHKFGEDFSTMEIDNGRNTIHRAHIIHRFSNLFQAASLSVRCWPLTKRDINVDLFAITKNCQTDTLANDGILNQVG